MRTLGGVGGCFLWRKHTDGPTDSGRRTLTAALRAKVLVPVEGDECGADVFPLPGRFLRRPGQVQQRGPRWASTSPQRPLTDGRVELRATSGRTDGWDVAALWLMNA